MKKAHMVLAIVTSLPLLMSTAQAQFGLPVILSAAVDSTNDKLTISGEHFTQVSTVTLGILQLPVQGTPTSTQIVAAGISSVMPGSYVIKVKFTNGTLAFFAVSLDAARQALAPTRTKYYLTKDDTFDGAHALTACTSGYHMASLWEIFNMSALQYDTANGFTSDDSGSGPPIALGWVRTGAEASDKFGGAGGDNCAAWTSASFGDGTTVNPGGLWDSVSGQFGGPNRIAPWFAHLNTCSSTQRVWCVQN